MKRDNTNNLRPPRLYYDETKKRFYFIIKKNKMYLPIKKSHQISHSQIGRTIINNIFMNKSTHVRVKKRINKIPDKNILFSRPLTTSSSPYIIPTFTTAPENKSIIGYKEAPLAPQLPTTTEKLPLPSLPTTIEFKQTEPQIINDIKNKSLLLPPETLKKYLKDEFLIKQQNEDKNIERTLKQKYIKQQNDIKRQLKDKEKEAKKEQYRKLKDFLKQLRNSEKRVREDKKLSDKQKKLELKKLKEEEEKQQQEQNSIINAFKIQQQKAIEDLKIKEDNEIIELKKMKETKKNNASKIITNLFKKLKNKNEEEKKQIINSVIDDLINNSIQQSQKQQQQQPVEEIVQQIEEKIQQQEEILKEEKKTKKNYRTKKVKEEEAKKQQQEEEAKLKQQQEEERLRIQQEEELLKQKKQQEEQQQPKTDEEITSDFNKEIQRLNQDPNKDPNTKYRPIYSSNAKNIIGIKTIISKGKVKYLQSTETHPLETQPLETQLLETQPPQEEQIKEGSGKYTNFHDGLYDDQIEDIFQDKLHHFVPVIMSDQIPTLLKYISPNTKRFGFVINSTSSKTKGQHWRSVFLDFEKGNIDYYDSLVSDPTKEFLKDIKLLINKVNPPFYMRLRVNRLKDQSDLSNNCGMFASRFIIDSYKGKTFNYDDGIDHNEDEGEREIETFKNYL
jgi:hypothetical protein